MTTYIPIQHKTDVYEFAASQLEDGWRIAFVNLYEEGRTQPKEISFSEVPDEVVSTLMEKLV